MNIQRLRDEWVDWVDDHSWDDYLTINFNCRSTIATGKQQFGKLCQRLDKSLLGQKYRKRPLERTLIIGFPEHVNSNFHIHCLVKYNRIRREPRLLLEQILQLKWKEIVPSGTVDLRNAYNVAGAVRYSTKEFGSVERFNDVILSCEFWPEPIRQEHEAVDWNRLRVLKQRSQYANYVRR